ncbi:MAG: hypothetical protein RL094_15 [Candidatus Parcubacteria bacterium]|jgi:hypothetical protein
MISVYEDGKLIIRVLLIAFFVLTIIGYSIFQSKKILTGPEISVSAPLSGSTLTQSDVVVKGVAKNISFISLNDRPIYIDEAGNFQEKLLLYPGYNIIKLQARDKFGASVEKHLELIYKP